MTLTDLFKLIKHYICLFMIIVLVCTIACGAYGFSEAKNGTTFLIGNNSNTGSRMAQSTLLVSNQAEGIGGIASIEADKWNRNHNERYADWLLAENERMQNQFENAENNTSKKSVDDAPGAWLRASFAYDFKDLTIVQVQTLEDSNTINVVAIGPDSEQCITAANDVAGTTESIAHELYDGDANPSGSVSLMLGQSKSIEIVDDRVNIELVKANDTTPAYPLIDENVVYTKSNNSFSFSKKDGSTLNDSTLKYGAIGLLGGILLGLIVVMMVNYIRKPIFNAEKIAESLEAPVVVSPNKHSKPDVVSANIMLVAADDAQNVSLVSVNDPTASSSILKMVEGSELDSGLAIINAGSLSGSGKAISEISKSDGVVLCMREWKDRIPELENAMNELTIAKANLIGIAVLGEK